MEGRGLVAIVIHYNYTYRLLLQEPSNDFSRSSILEILRNVEQIPDRWQTAIKNNGGGYVNHILYWATMCPEPEAISSNLKSAIERSFGSFENFKEQFTSTAKSLFGSGYVWLCEDGNSRLFILTSANQVHLTVITCM